MYNTVYVYIMWLRILYTQVIQHPDSLVEMQILVQKLLVILANDPVTKATLGKCDSLIFRFRLI